MNQYINTLIQSVRNYTLPILEEIMTEHYDAELLPTIIKSRLLIEYAKDPRIEQVLDIAITEEDEIYQVLTTIKAVNYNEPIEI